MPRFLRFFTELPLSYILLINLCITAAFAFVSNDQSLNFMPDEKEYVMLADRALQGDFNFDIGRFIRSPLYPLFLAALKLVFGSYWLNATIVMHVLFQTLACAGLYFLTKELFN